MSVVPQTIAGMGIAWVLYHAISEWKIFGGTHPRTDMQSFDPKHKLEEQRRFMSMVSQAQVGYLCYFGLNSPEVEQIYRREKQTLTTQSS